MVQAVTFDFWNTLMWETPGSLRAQRLDVWGESLSAAGLDHDPAALETAHDAAHRAYEDAWRAGRQFVVEDAVRQILRDLDGRLAPAAEPLLVAGFSEAGRRAAVTPSEGVHACLEELRAAGVRLGIVCDIGLTPSAVVRELLDRAGLLELFDDTAFSDKVGHYKPAPQFFHHALAALGVPAQHAAHVGDRTRTDVAGAQAVGMTAIRYTRTYDDPVREPEADLVLDHLADVPAALAAAALRG